MRSVPFLLLLALGVSAPAHAAAPLLSTAEAPLEILTAVGARIVVEVPADGRDRLWTLRSEWKDAKFAGRGGPEGLIVQSDGTVRYRPTPDQVGTYELVVRMEVGGLPQGAANVLIVVREAPAEPAGAEQEVDLLAGTEEEVAPVPAAAPQPYRRPASSNVPRGSVDDQTLLIAYGIGYGAYAGGVSGYLIGEINEDGGGGQGVAPGALLGAAAGGITAGLVGSQRELARDETMLIASSTAIGAFAGSHLAGAVIPEGADAAVERINGSGLAGSIAGAGIGLIASERAPDTRAMVHVDLATGLGWASGNGAARLLGDPTRQQQYAAELGGAAVLGGFAVLANDRGWRPDSGAVALGVAHGAWVGGWAPLLVDEYPDDAQRVAGVQAGLGVGYLAAFAMSPFGETDDRSVGLQTIGFASGTALGAGLPLAMGAGEHPRDVVAPMLAIGALGRVGGAAIAPHYELSRDDMFLVATLESWTAYQAVGWGVYASQVSDTPEEPIGYALTAGGAGTLMAVGLAPALEVDPAGSVMLLSAGAWGTWTGGWTGSIVSDRPQDQWLITLASGNGALAAAAIAEGAGWKPTWSDVGRIDGYGALGGASGGLVGLVFLYDAENWDPMFGSIVVGTAAGLCTGAVMATMDDGRSELAVALPDLPRLGIDATAHVSARPWVDDDGNPGAWVQLDVLETR
jgi:hypothetical protein